MVAELRDDRRDELILVYRVDAGLLPLLADVAKKAVGIEDCALCELTYGRLGERRAWKSCKTRLGVAVTKMHRNELPPEWNISGDAVPCVLRKRGRNPPEVLLSKDELEAFAGKTEAFAAALRSKLGAREDLNDVVPQTVEG